MRVIVLLGAPGAGKGTQAEILVQRSGMAHVATGDLFRAAVRDETPLGLEAKRYMDRGELVPDALTVRMLLERLDLADAQAGVILDGFPRTAAQAGALDAALADRGGVERAILVDVPPEALLARLTGRWICRAAGHVFHEVSNPPRTPGVCDADGSDLYQRDDDRREVVEARLKNQLGALADVIAYYRGKGLLATVDGLRPIDEVSAALGQLLDAGAVR